MSAHPFCRDVLEALVASGLPQEDLGSGVLRIGRRSGWFAEASRQQLAEVSVFWGDGSGKRLAALPERREGLLSVIEAPAAL